LVQMTWKRSRDWLGDFLERVGSRERRNHKRRTVERLFLTRLSNCHFCSTLAGTKINRTWTLMKCWKPWALSFGHSSRAARGLRSRFWDMVFTSQPQEGHEQDQNESGSIFLKTRSREGLLSDGLMGHLRTTRFGICFRRFCAFRGLCVANFIRSPVFAGVPLIRWSDAMMAR